MSRSVLPEKWASRRYPGHNDHIPGTTSYLRSRTFQSYFAMINRCCYESNYQWDRYGGRGIEVCARWRESFDNFLQDMGHRPKGHSLDRIDVNGNYEPGNCKWSTASEQRRNQRRAQKAS